MPRFRQPARIFTEPFVDLLNKQKPREELNIRPPQARLPLNFRYSQLPSAVKAVCAACGLWYQAVPKRLIRCRRCRATATSIVKLPPVLMPWQLLRPGNDLQSQYNNTVRAFNCRRCARVYHNWAVFGCMCTTEGHIPRWCRICCAATNPTAYGLDAQTPGLPVAPTLTDPTTWFHLYRQGGADFDKAMYIRYLIEALGYSQISARNAADTIERELSFDVVPPPPDDLDFNDEELDGDGDEDEEEDEEDQF